MRDRILQGKLVSNSIWYFGSYAMSGLIPLLIIPLLTKTLTPTEYGQIAMYQLFVTVLTPLLGFNTLGLISVEFYKERSRERLQNLQSAILLLWFISSAMMLLVITALSGRLVDYFNTPTYVFSLAWATATAQFLINFATTNWQMLGRVKLIAINLLLVSLSAAALAVWWVVIEHYGALGRIGAQSIIVLVSGLTVAYLIRKEGVFGHIRNALGQVLTTLKYGFSLFPHTFGLIAIAAADRFFIHKYFSLEDVGVYAIALQFSIFISMSVEAFNKAYMPWLFQKLANKSRSENLKIVQVIYVYFVVLCIILGMFFPASAVLVRWFVDPAYHDAIRIVGVLGLGHGFHGMYLMVNNFLYHEKKNTLISAITLSTGALYFIGLSVFLAGFDITFVAVLYAISQFIKFIVTWALGSYYHPMPWSLRPLQDNGK